MTDDAVEPQTLNRDEWISKPEAARLRGVSRQAIWDLVHRGRITSTRFAGRIYVDRAEVMNFTRRPRGPNGMGYVKGKVVRLKKKNFDPSKWISMIEAARAMGVTRQVIGDLVRRRRVRTLESAGKTFVQRAGVENFKPLPRKSKTKRAKKK
jgi:excisionase family DNA binding protein